jgi:hypothetical protein
MVEPRHLPSERSTTRGDARFELSASAFAVDMIDMATHRRTLSQCCCRFFSTTTATILNLWRRADAAGHCGEAVAVRATMDGKTTVKMHSTWKNKTKSTPETEIKG